MTSLRSNSKELLIDSSIVLKKNERKEFKINIEDGLNQFAARVDGIDYNLYGEEIKYDHIPAINYFKKSEVNCKFIDLKFKKKKIGYIEGAPTPVEAYP